ncbi:hemerythrin domain-containing protein [Paenibacillus spongiae]|uniref:Hemerythrin domain-containing protein n=1 Tax=Paenibacillus spongiae TaxID=2909671 RepID=A0ABY5S8T9_9BACL|nr:hemerythrin domain-containing protein [Paenibacillus spongiae]UVI29215.1 hemerythrin domain-containing protein [Paenibacillus spongiae]
MFHRFDLYAQVHKGIRLALSSLCYQAGSANCSDDEKVLAFVEEFRRVVVILEAHSRDEDAHLNESYNKYAPDTLLQLEEEHSGLELGLGKLTVLVDQLELNMQGPVGRRNAWYQVGKALNRFTADYLIHLQREEGPGMTALWEHLSDEELKMLSQNIRSSIPPQTMAIFMHYIIPAISHEERVEMIGEMKLYAPKEAYAGVLGLAESRLDAMSWNRLKAALEEVEADGVSL